MIRASGMSSSRPSSSAVGSRSSSWCMRRRVRTTLLTCSARWTGSRMVRPESAIARVIACRIHQVAYVENLKPLV